MKYSKDYWNKPRSKNSKIKTKIVTQLFEIWLETTQKKENKLALLDLFCGKCKHSNGDLSTTIKLLRIINSKKNIINKLFISLNDKSRSNLAYTKNVLLRSRLDSELKEKINYSSNNINDTFCENINSIFLSTSFSFIDPFGYKGISLALIKLLTKEKNSDAVIFFHTSGINRNIFKKKTQINIRKIFEKEEYKKLLKELKNSKSKLNAISNCFFRSLKKTGIKYILYYDFLYKKTNLTTHQLFIVTNNRSRYIRFKKYLDSLKM